MVERDTSQVQAAEAIAEVAESLAKMDVDAAVSRLKPKLREEAVKNLLFMTVAFILRILMKSLGDKVYQSFLSFSSAWITAMNNNAVKRSAFYVDSSGPAGRLPEEGRRKLAAIHERADREVHAEALRMLLASISQDAPVNKANGVS